MSQLNIKLQELKDHTIDAMHLVRSQLAKSKDAFMQMDATLAEEINHYENHVNATELAIDRECEKIFALFHPVAIDLRFVLASLKIINHLERIGDHACGVARTVAIVKTPFSDELLAELRFREMFDTSISMLDDAVHAFNFEDTKLARLIFGKDTMLNAINRDSGRIISEALRKDPDNAERYLNLFSTMRKVERIGDLTKNIAEDTIFFIEAKVLKHKAKD
jgi:phosphate transport system protein